MARNKNRKHKLPSRKKNYTKYEDRTDEWGNIDNEDVEIN